MGTDDGIVKAKLRELNERRGEGEGSSAPDSSTTWEKNGDDTACGCAVVKESDKARCLSSRRKVNPS